MIYFCTNIIYRKIKFSKICKKRSETNGQRYSSFSHKLPYLIEHISISIFFPNALLSDDDPNQITKMLPGRTDNAVKNRFHATCRQQSRKDCGEDDKLCGISASFEGHTDCDSVEGDSLQAASPTPRQIAITRIDRAPDPIPNCHADLFIDIGDHSLFSAPPVVQKTTISNNEKTTKSEKKKKKASISSSTEKIAKTELPQDTASLNEHYIAKLNEYFASAPVTTPAIALNPVFEPAVSINRPNTKPLHQPHQRIVLQPSYNQQQSTSNLAHHLEYSLKRAKCSVAVSQPFQARPVPPSRVSQVPLGLPHFPRGVLPTTGKLHGVAFHELSLKERLAPARPSSPTYSDDFRMNITSGDDLDLDEFMFDTWLDDETEVIDIPFTNDIGVPYSQANYEWANNECTNICNDDIQSCFATSQVGTRGSVFESNTNIGCARTYNQLQCTSFESSLAQNPVATSPSGFFALRGRFSDPSNNDINF